MNDAVGHLVALNPLRCAPRATEITAPFGTCFTSIRKGLMFKALQAYASEMGMIAWIYKIAGSLKDNNRVKGGTYVGSER